MGIVKDLLIRIGADPSGASAALKSLAADSDKFEQKLSKAATISGAAFAASTAAIGVAVMRFSDFEKGFTNVVTLLDQGSFKAKSLEAGIKSLKNGVIDLSAESGESFDTLNKGLFDLISAGVPAEKAITALREATDLAAAGATNVAVAVDGLTSAMNAFQIPAEEARLVAQKFFTAQKVGKTTIEELSNGFGLAGATAAAYGVSLNELLGAVSAVTTAGVKTNSAYTGLNALLVNISKPTDEAKKEAARLGIEFTSTALRAKGLEKFLADLTAANGFTQESVEKLFGSVEAQKIAFALTGAQAGIFGSILKDLGNQTILNENYDNALVKSKETVSKALSKIKQSADAALVTLGEQFAPVILSVAKAAETAVKWFRGLDESTIAAIANFMKVAVAVTGAVFAFASLALGAAKVISIAKNVYTAIGLVSTAFKVGRVAVAGFTGVATGGLSILLMFLPEIISGLKAAMPFWKDLFGFKATTSVEDLGKKLREVSSEIQKQKDIYASLRETQRDLHGEAKSYYLHMQGATGDRIKALEKERDAVLASMRKNDPKAPAGGGEGGASADPAEEAKTKAMAEEIKKRIDLADQEYKLLRAKQDGATDQELSAMKQRFDLEQQEKEANLLLNDELRKKELANIALKNDELMKLEEELAQRRAEFNMETAAADTETMAALTQADNEALAASFQSKLDMESAYARKSIEVRRAALAQKFEDEKKHGRLYAEFNAVMSTEEVKNFQSTNDELIKLSNSKNATMKAIGKAATLTKITMDTASAAMGAFNSLSGIPYVGYALGLAAAIAVGAYGAERASEVMGAQKGAYVQGVGMGDRVPAALERGELVVPAKATQQFLPVIAREQARQDAANNGLIEGNGSVQEVGIRLLDRAEEFITVEQQRRATIGVR